MIIFPLDLPVFDAWIGYIYDEKPFDDEIEHQTGFSILNHILMSTQPLKLKELSQFAEMGELQVFTVLEEFDVFDNFCDFVQLFIGTLLTWFPEDFSQSLLLVFLTSSGLM